MKVLVLVCALLIPSIAQAQYRLGAPIEAAWDYTLADVTTGGILRFEFKLDAGPWVNTGLPPNATSYVYVIPALGLTVGSHTAQVRACNTQECSPEPSPTITFTVIRPIPKPPVNFKIQPGTVLADTQMIFDMGNAYSMLVNGKNLNNGDWNHLYNTYKGIIPVTLDSLMGHLDSQLLLLR